MMAALSNIVDLNADKCSKGMEDEDGISDFDMNRVIVPLKHKVAHAMGMNWRVSI